MRRLISIIFLFVFIAESTCLNAQEMNFSVTEFKQDPFDMSAKEISKDDGDGYPYAIIKIISDIEDDNVNSFKFDFGYIKSQKEIHDGQLWVYVQRNAKNVTIRREGYRSIINYSLGLTIKAGSTYVMKLSVQQPKILQRVLQFKITPPNENTIVKVKPENSNEDYELWGTVDSSGSIDRLMDVGVYLYEVSANNFVSSQGRVQLTNGSGNYVENVTLTPNFGFLEVDNTYGIAGADVWINNKKVGVVPYKSDRMECGKDYKIMISNGELYKTFNSTFAIRRGETTRISPRLESNFAETTIIVDGNAEIFVNGESKGHSSWKGPLRTGTYNIECRLEGHTSSLKQITVRPDVAETFAMDKPTPIEGSLYIRSNPSGARIIIDGKETSYVTPQNISNILVGNHKVSLELANHKSETRTIEIIKGENTTLDVKLSDIAEMKISSNPPGAFLYIDNEEMGSTPYSSEMASGEYLIRLEKNKYKTFYKRVHLDSSHPDQTFKLQWQYQRKNQLYVQPTFQAGSFMSVGLSIGGFFHNFNFETGFMYGISTEMLYWNYNGNDLGSNYNSLEDRLGSMCFSCKLGYGICVGARLRITPQFGVGLQRVNGTISSSYAINGAFGVRADWALTKHLGVVLAPEYNFPFTKSESFKQISNISSKVKGWGGGFNVRVGLNIYF